MYNSSINTWALDDSPLAQLVKDLDLCLFLCVIQRPWDRLPAESINYLSLQYRRAYCYGNAHTWKPKKQVQYSRHKSQKLKKHLWVILGQAISIATCGG